MKRLACVLRQAVCWHIVVLHEYLRAVLVQYVPGYEVLVQPYGSCTVQVPVQYKSKPYEYGLYDEALTHTMSTTPGAAVLRRFHFAAASLAVCAVVDARSSVHLTCDNNLRINPPEGEREKDRGGNRGGVLK